jgi:hypothetical protein
MYTDAEIKNRWNLMFERCYKGINKCYSGAAVCSEWENYDNFKEWFLANIYGTKQFKLEIDKDLFGKGKKLYSPDTCCLLPKSVNAIISSCKSRNEYLPGVSRVKNGKYKASINRNGSLKYKIFDSEYDAFNFYKEEKEKSIQILAESYKFLLPEKIYNALINFKL